jgi:hypothetical protein
MTRNLMTLLITTYYSGNQIEKNEMGAACRMYEAGHVACMGEREVHTGFWWGDVRESDYLAYPGVDGRII